MSDIHHSARTKQIIALKKHIEEIEDHLDSEMLVNDQLTDTNIRLKAEISKLKERLKLVAHPTTIGTLKAGLIQSEKNNKILSDNLQLAVDLIPRTEANEMYLRHLFEICQKCV